LKASKDERLTCIMTLLNDIMDIHIPCKDTFTKANVWKEKQKKMDKVETPVVFQVSKKALLEQQNEKKKDSLSKDSDKNNF
jgi:hypothetical protein